MNGVWQCEVYAECARRDVETAHRFLRAFAPSWVEGADEYPLPQYSASPREVFRDAESLLVCLERERAEYFGIYWHRPAHDPGEPHDAMLFFTHDGGMIAGLGSAFLEPKALLKQLAAVVDARFGMAVFEEPPPDTCAEFRERCRGAITARLADGKFHSASCGGDLR